MSGGFSFYGIVSVWFSLFVASLRDALLGTGHFMIVEFCEKAGDLLYLLGMGYIMSSHHTKYELLYHQIIREVSHGRH